MPDPEQALPGRQEKMPVPDTHFVNGHELAVPLPDKFEQAMFGLGCFWGVERKFWELTGIYSTAVGYAGGFTLNPTYEELCTGMTGHTEVVYLVFEPKLISYERLLKIFWESHDPTQGMQQGNDVGTQYRSAIYAYNDEQSELAINSLKHFQQRLTVAGKGMITTEVGSAPEFYYAEPEHQQYLAKNPNGYCGLAGLGVSYVE